MKPYYEHGGITIYHGDCREVIPSLCGPIRLVWTDPPYGHGNQSEDLQAARMRDGVKGGSTKTPEPIAHDGDSMRLVVSEALELLAPLMASDCCCCCCAGGGGPTPTFAWLSNHLDTNPWKFFHAVVWDKSDRGPGLGWKFRRDYEFVMVAHLRNGGLSLGSNGYSNIMRVRPEVNHLHPNQKPEELVGLFIGGATQAGELVVDPFMGSGTTLAAAKRMGRRAIGIDVEERYCDVAARRLSQGALDLELPA